MLVVFFMSAAVPYIISVDDIFVFFWNYEAREQILQKNPNVCNKSHLVILR